jgi:outer membrane lipid asymmetry maintenance protein MlaD
LWSKVNGAQQERRLGGALRPDRSRRAGVPGPAGGNLLTLSFQPTYRLSARFDNIGGLKPRAAVKSSGVVVGRVESITFDDKTFRAAVTLALESRYQFPKDSSLKILTSGLLGEQYVGIEAGADDKPLAGGDTIASTQSAVILGKPDRPVPLQQGGGRAAFRCDQEMKTSCLPAARAMAALASGLLMLGLLGACASVPNPNPRDPLEPLNRQTHKLNDSVDKVVLKPVGHLLPRQGAGAGAHRRVELLRQPHGLPGPPSTA